VTKARILSLLAVTYVALDLIHFVDHLRQGRSLPLQIYVVGNIGLVVAIVVAVLAVRALPLAAPAATAFGYAAALGVTATHILPAWGFFSDSYTSLKVDALSWISASSLVAAALALAACGTLILLRPAPPLEASAPPISS
jgi:hypothetical protein